jgi:hypothetical protein
MRQKETDPPESKTAGPKNIPTSISQILLEVGSFWFFNLGSSLEATQASSPTMRQLPQKTDPDAGRFLPLGAWSTSFAYRGRDPARQLPDDRRGANGARNDLVR